MHCDKNVCNILHTVGQMYVFHKYRGKNVCGTSTCIVTQMYALISQQSDRNISNTPTYTL